MKENKNKTERPGQPGDKICTKLKFIKSDKNGALISFVSQNPVTNVVCGVRQESPYPKKIVITAHKIAKEILVNVLYDCVLIPMTKVLNENTGEYYVPGYVAIEATPVQFKATVTTKYIRGIQYLVEVSFGNKVIRFDPFRGRQESVKSFPACKAVLEKRCDVKDLMDVIEDFEIAAFNIVQLMKQDMRQIHNNKPNYDKTHRRNSY